MQLESALVQPLTKRISRWLLTYSKLRDAHANEPVLPPPISSNSKHSGVGYRVQKKAALDLQLAPVVAQL